MRYVEETRPGASVSCRALFVVFGRMGLLGFGGVLPWARRVLVEEEGWLTDPEYAEVLALGQVLPGPNIVNLAVVVGDRFQGPLGALSAVGGLLLPPVLLIAVVAVAYQHWGALPAVRHAIQGMTGAAAGLGLGQALKMGWNLRSLPVMLPLAAVAFAGVAVVGWPLPLVVLGLAPVGVLVATRS